MGLRRWRVKKIGPLPSSYISSFSVSAKYSIKLCKYAADFASALRFGLSALVCFTPQTLQVRCGPRLKLSSALRSNINLDMTAGHLQSLRRGRTALAKSEAWTVSHLQSLKRDRSALAKSEAWTAAYLQSLRRGPQCTCKVSGGAALHFLGPDSIRPLKYHLGVERGLTGF